jgi:DNA polymerase III subunit chi
MATAEQTTKIAFHTNITDKSHYVCRLIRKANAANCRVVVLQNNLIQLQSLDEALWTFADTSFLPHVFANDPNAERTAIVLAKDAEQNFPHYELLINLSNQVPANFERFGRLIEIVTTDQDDKLAGRQRYKTYQQAGYTPEHLEVKTA